MFLDALMKFGTNAMNGMMDTVPDWQSSLDVSKVRQLLQTLQVWNNWLPLDQLCICIGIAVGLWIALQALAAAFKTLETVKP